MTKINSRTVSTRLQFNELAKARDGLIARGIDPKDIQTTSQILRLSIYFTILNCDDPKSLASQESQEHIQQLWKQSKMTKNLDLDDLTK